MPHEATPDMSWEDITSAISMARSLNQGPEQDGTMDVLLPDDALGLTEISSAFVRIPGLLLISDMEISPDVSQATLNSQPPGPLQRSG